MGKGQKIKLSQEKKSRVRRSGLGYWGVYLKNRFKKVSLSAPFIYLTSYWCVIVLLKRKVCGFQTTVCAEMLLFAKTDGSATVVTITTTALELNKQIIKARNTHQSNFVFAPHRNITVKASNDSITCTPGHLRSRVQINTFLVPSLWRGNCVETTSVLRAAWLMGKKRCLSSI